MGIGIATILTDTKKTSPEAKLTDTLKIEISAFIVGIISHGALDYIPHCYPINSRVDVILGLAFIIVLTLLANNKYKGIIGLTLIGCIFPDLVDLSPAIINKNLGFNLPILDKVFPWHWHVYSGSIYNYSCGVSTINHLLVIVAVGIVCWYRRADFSNLFLN
ncbi:hypothetical protein [Adhaeribacter pallidiroseus]|uniref:hypothetical protein n=1 Tax=Adhaeribacter pallidiroseus TaxID=2072847 RepID=UPI000E1C07FF|nr:hypothetical protein [Adhaeribacter pallidiroseus]